MNSDYQTHGLTQNPRGSESERLAAGLVRLGYRAELEQIDDAERRLCAQMHADAGDDIGKIAAIYPKMKAIRLEWLRYAANAVCSNMKAAADAGLAYPAADAPAIEWAAHADKTRELIAKHTCSDLQSSAVGIANIGRSCARSLQLDLELKPKMIASGRKLTATGIAIIRRVRTLIATQTAAKGLTAVPTAVLVILPPLSVAM